MASRGFGTYRFDKADIGKEKYKIRNGAVYFERYSLWKEYVKSDFDCFINTEDYYRFLNQIYRRKLEFREVLGVILVPVIAGCITGILSMESAIEKVISCSFWILFLSIFFTSERIKATSEVDFLGDYIEIVKSKI